MIITYAQGMALLAAASDKYEYHLDLEAVARIWRGGCIIRAALLEDIRAAYRNQPDLPNLLLAPELSQKVMANEEDLRQVVCTAQSTWVCPHRVSWQRWAISTPIAAPGCRPT